MGFFDFLKKSSDASRWNDLDSDDRIENIALPILQRVAPALEGARARKKGSDAELTGTLEGFPCRVEISWSGGVKVIVRYDEELPRLNVDHDPSAKPDPTSWEKADRRVAVAPHIFIADNVQERGAFESLPAELKSRALETLARKNLSWLRSGTGETEVDVRGGIAKLASPDASLSELLRLTLDVAKARGATPSPPPGTPIDPKQPFAGWKHLGQEEKWSRAVAFAEALAPRVHGRVEANREELDVEVRWTEHGIPLRIALNLHFLHVEPGAITKGITQSLDLYWDPKLTVREDLSGDPWSDDAEVIFLAPSIILRGDESEVRAQMALIRAIPITVLDELFEVMTRHRLAWVNLEDEYLSVSLPNWPKTDDGTAAIEVARMFGRVAAALPRAAVAPMPDRVVRCKFCRGLWFPTERHAACTHCGAPA